ncbi:PPM-type phosphatase domain containing protein [Rhabdaerophilaceae bacterium]
MKLQSFRAKILIIVLGIVGLSAAGIMLFTNWRVQDAIFRSEDRAATNTVELIALDLASRYDGLLSEKLKTLQIRRSELETSGQNLVHGIEGFRALFANAVLSEDEAKRQALGWMNRVSFPRGRLAFVYDTSLRIMSFPQPDMIGRDLSTRSDFKGRPLAAAMLAEARAQKRSFATFRWPRPNGGSDTKFALFIHVPHWDWVVVVADDVQDIEVDTNQGLDQIRMSMTETMSRLSIARSGFAFVFRGDEALVVPPREEHTSLLKMTDSVSSLTLVQHLKQHGKPTSTARVAFAPQGINSSPWEARIAYFKALDWYIAALVPREDLTAPALSLLADQAIIFVGVLIFGLGIAFLSSSRLLRPLNILADHAREFPQRDLSAAWQPNTRIASIAQRGSGDEVSHLATTFLSMEQQLRERLRELMDETAARQRIASELAIAREIQAGFLPDLGVEIGSRCDIDVAAVVRPAKEVGGDLFDVFPIAGGRFCLAVGDVSGKGVPAAFFMGIARTLLRASAEIESSPAAMLKRVNEGLSQNNPNMMFVTMFVTVLDLTTGDLLYANAGHPPPILSGTNDGIRRLNGEAGPACGVLVGVDYPENADRLDPDVVLTIFTDGVSDMENETRDFYGEGRIKETLGAASSRSAQAVLDRLLAETIEFAGAAPQADDLTILTVRRPASVSSQATQFAIS